MSDGQRAAPLYLLLKQRHNGAVGAEHIAEANGNEFCAELALRLGCGGTGMNMQRGDTAHIAVLNAAVKRLDDHLTQSLAGAHNIGRVDSLIRAYEHKALAVIYHCRIGGLIGADDVVFDSFTGAVLHQRDMLMSRGMVHNVGMIFFEYILKPS